MSRNYNNRRSRGRNNRGGGGNKYKKHIDTRRYINHDVVPNKQKNYESTHTFEELGLQSAIIDNLKAAGITKPTAIQDQAVKPILEGGDVVGLANTGTGKTAAFLLPIIELISRDIQHNHTLIIAPTRELANQVNDEFKVLSRGSGLKTAVCVGGLSIKHQIRALKQGAHVIVGTPGRLKDLAQRRALNLDKLQTLVLDEADQMLDMGFLPDMKHMINLAPKDRQLLCFSATTNPKSTKLFESMLNNPTTISVLAKTTSKHIHQDVIKVHDHSQKLEQLVDLIDNDDFGKVLVFGETKHGVRKLADKLTKRGFNSASIHGNKSQSQRQRALNSFKSNQTRVLVATDVASRGLDVPNVDLVVNYDQPNDHDTYIHRIGRTGRAGESGHARTFV